MSRVLPVTLAAAALMASALGLVLSRHEARLRFTELETLRAEEQRLGEEYGRLVLERATLATPTRVEQRARDELDMVVPTVSRTIVVAP